MQVTSLEQLKKVKRTEIIELGKFEDGTPLVVEVKQPDMMGLMASGKIPNALLKPAMKVFNGKTKEITDKIALDDVTALKDIAGLIEMLADICLVNPTHKEIKDCGLDLTENMKIALLVYIQGGIQSLEGFRSEQEHNQSDKLSSEVQ